MDKSNHVVVKEKSNRGNIVVIVLAIVILIAGAIGIWWYSR
jgi:hypothetical protein